MAYRLRFTPKARSALFELKAKNRRKYSKVVKVLRTFGANPRHPGLRSHEFLVSSKAGKLWGSSVENRTPGAHRIFWRYDPEDSEITIVAVIKHP